MFFSTELASKERHGDCTTHTLNCNLGESLSLLAATLALMVVAVVNTMYSVSQFVPLPPRATNKSSTRCCSASTTAAAAAAAGWSI